jgi:hypothetical protein
MDGAPPTECTCGAMNFERIVVERRGLAPYRTPFVACAECRRVYYDPEALEPEPSKQHGVVTTTEPHKHRR